MHDFLRGNEVKYFPRSLFSFLFKVLWLKECGLEYFMWNCGTFWEALTRSSQGSEGGARMWCSRWKREYDVLKSEQR